MGESRRVKFVKLVLEIFAKQMSFCNFLEFLKFTKYAQGRTLLSLVLTFRKKLFGTTQILWGGGNGGKWGVVGGNTPPRPPPPIVENERPGAGQVRENVKLYHIKRKIFFICIP